MRKIFDKELIWQDWVLIILLIIGLLVGGWEVFRSITIPGQAQVEYIDAANTVSNKKIMVDIAGSVVLPGVYELMEGARVKDVLVLAGGLSSSADRDYIEKQMNMADKVTDGQKIYVPSSINNTGVGHTEAISKVKLININIATIEELDTLYGIGKAKAEGIIAGRPYSKIEDVVTKGGVAKSTFEKIKGSLSVY